ncbi:MAG: FtsX-like permease family protein [Acidimicrobiales bacterium]
MEVIGAMSHALRIAWFRYRTSFRRRWTSYLSVVVLIGSVGGLALASVAGARRTESSFPTYVASTNPSTLVTISSYNDPALGDKTGYNAQVAEKIAHLPLVQRATSGIIFDGNINLPAIKGVHLHVLAGETPPTFLGSSDGELSQVDRVSLVAGRLASPDRRGEAVMNAQAAAEMGLHLGSIITIPFYTDTQNQNAKSEQTLGKPFLVVKVKMVGEIVLPSTLVESDIDSLGSPTVIFSSALTRILAPRCATGTETFLQLKGGDPNDARVEAEVNHVDPLANKFGGFQVTSRFIPSALQAIEPESIALGVFGGIAGLAVLLIAALMIGRILRVESDETNKLRALGADRRTMLSDQAGGILGAVLVGSLLALVVAFALSPLAPLGPVRPVDPDPGLSFDGTALGLGFLTLLIVLSAVTWLLARRELRRITSRSISNPPVSEPRLVRSIANSGLPVSMVTGVRFALESGKGRNATPVRSAILGTVMAVTVLVTTVTFGASLNDLVSHPSLYGWNWNYAMLASFAGAEDLPAHQTATFFAQDHDVAAWSGVYFSGGNVNGRSVSMLAERPGASVAPPLLSGHGLDAPNQIVLGSSTLAQVHAKVGDTVTFNNGISKPTKLLVVGTATMPALGDGLGLGSGALVSTSDFPASLLNLQNAIIPGPNAILIRIRSGISPSAAYRSLKKIEMQINAIPQANGLAGGIVTVLRPVEIVNFHSMGTTPTIFASSLALGAIAALGLTLGASVRRRRRDLALLKALGFTQRQLTSVVAWQATVAAIIGSVIGIPLGIEIGRELWILFARSIDAVPSPTVPVLSMVLIGLGALVFANLVAAIPGRIAARTSTALVLRSE